MGEMQMPLPDNTLPMVAGGGPIGMMEMGGMFSIVKVREGIDAKDYGDPAGTGTRPARSPIATRVKLRNHREPAIRRTQRPEST